MARIADVNSGLFTPLRETRVKKMLVSNIPGSLGRFGNKTQRCALASS